ncbi:MAG: ribonuclease HI family protein [Actinobacteria bacterium]|nr:MAG: ribonuclease HI family protein [Actinomycetota bacterium]
MTEENYGYLKIYFDGGSRGNPGPSAVGAVVYDDKDKKLEELSAHIGEHTNNVAEYMALDKVLDLVEKYHCRKIILFTDSKLLNNQIKKVWKIKDSGILKIYLKVSEKLSKYDLVDLRLISRKNNIKADRLVNQALDKREFTYEGESKISFGNVDE